MHFNAFLIPWGGDHFFYAFPPFNIIPKVLQKVHFDQPEAILIVPKWPNQPWYSLLIKMLANEPIVLPPRKDLLYLPNNPEEIHPLHTSCLPHFREKLEYELLSEEAIGILLNSLSSGLAKQYQRFVSQWTEYCHVFYIDRYTASVTKGTEFLTKLFKSKDLGYSSLNTAGSALSLIIKPHNGISFGKHPLVQRFMKGVFGLRPTLPKYTFTFDATVVLQYLKQMSPHSQALTKGRIPQISYDNMPTISPA